MGSSRKVCLAKGRRERSTGRLHPKTFANIDVGGDGDTRTDGERYVDWGRRYWTGIEAFTGGGFYVNSSIDDDERRIRGNYGGNFERLVAVKTQYDPANLFRLNANVRPRARG